MIGLIFILAIGFLFPVSNRAAEPPKGHRILSLEEFIKQACEKDSVFQEILIEELKLQYAKTLALPPRDLVLSVRGEYGLSLDGTRHPNLAASLDKLFPLQGSSLSLQFESASRTGGDQVNDLTLRYAVDVARNAFGKANRLLDQITGLETDVARYQIAEAYEDYLAAQILNFYDWAAAYESIKAARAAVEEAEKFLENTQSKKQNYIAYQVDVDKAQFQLLAKQERMLGAERDYRSVFLQIARAMRITGSLELRPDSADLHLPIEIAFQGEVTEFFDSSRTEKVLKILHRRDSLQLDRAADNLLPSTQLFGGVGVSDASPSLAENARVFVGLQFSYPFGKSKEKAAWEVTRIDKQKRNLSNRNIRARLTSDFGSLRERIESQIAAIAIAEKRLSLAQSILDAETKEYIYGRTNINDLIQALNALQETRFVRISAEIQLNKLKVEWLRLADKLVKREREGAPPKPLLQPETLLFER